MDIQSIPEAFQVKLRLIIITGLMSGEKSFKELKQISEATDGNLSVQLSKLEEMGYVESKKQFIGKKPQTRYKLLKRAIDDFKAYVLLLEQILSENEKDMDEL